MPSSPRRVADVFLAATVALVVPLATAGTGAADEPAPLCAPDGETIELTGGVESNQARSYELLPVEVDDGVTRIEVGYAWADRGTGEAPGTPLTETVLDLGLWDADGAFDRDGFRGWSGSRQGRIDAEQDPIWVQVDDADRSYTPGPIEPGVWHVELGYAYVGPTGADWRVEVTCSAPDVGGPPAADPVDATHVASDEPGWYHGDLHIHAFHSSPDGPEFADAVEAGRDAGLDFFPITEYVVGRHWEELGAVQRDNPDVVVWPGREIITYFGHANVLGETPSTLEYRHGFADISIADIQADTVADGALYQVAHPAFFPGPALQSLCRGCEYELVEETDWSAVDTIEVLTGPAVVDPSDVGGPETPEGMQNPFIDDAIDLWEEQLAAGHPVTAVSGSDTKVAEGIGMNATAVFASELSRAGLIDGLRAGHAYVRTRGVDDSPALEVHATTDDGQQGIMGDTLHADAAEVTVTVTDGVEQLLRVIRDGNLEEIVAITDEEFTHSFTATRDDGSGPLGTFWRVETLDEDSLTTIANPVFLADPAAADPDDEPSDTPADDEVEDAPHAAPEDPTPVTEPAGGPALPATGTAAVAAGLLLLVAAGGAAMARRGSPAPSRRA